MLSSDENTTGNTTLGKGSTTQEDQKEIRVGMGAKHGDREAERALLWKSAPFWVDEKRKNSKRANGSSNEFLRFAEEREKEADRVDRHVRRAEQGG